MARVRSSSAGFQADIVSWVAKVGQRFEYVAKESSKAVYNDVRVPLNRGGAMPVISGNLRNSPEASISSMPVANRVPKPKELLSDPTRQVYSVIDSSNLGDKIFLAFTVAYAVYVNRRRAFVQLTAMKWQDIVRKKTIGSRQVIR